MQWQVSRSICGQNISQSCLFCTMINIVFGIKVSPPKTSCFRNPLIKQIISQIFIINEKTTLIRDSRCIHKQKERKINPVFKLIEGDLFCVGKVIVFPNFRFGTDSHILQGGSNTSFFYCTEVLLYDIRLCVGSTKPLYLIDNNATTYCIVAIEKSAGFVDQFYKTNGPQSLKNSLNILYVSFKKKSIISANSGVTTTFTKDQIFLASHLLHGFFYLLSKFLLYYLINFY